MNLVKGIIGIGVLCAFWYFVYWAVKSFSYWLFYENMVKETVMQILTAQGLL